MILPLFLSEMAKVYDDPITWLRWGSFVTGDAAHEKAHKVGSIGVYDVYCSNIEWKMKVGRFGSYCYGDYTLVTGDESLSMAQIIKYSKYVEIHRILVNPDRIGKGYGYLLIKWLIEHYGEIRYSPDMTNSSFKLWSKLSNEFDVSVYDGEYEEKICDVPPSTAPASIRKLVIGKGKKDYRLIASIRK
jgi:GNAT superfamily N-acetyltransferase